jgi:hypothetical protein
MTAVLSILKAWIITVERKITMHSIHTKLATFITEHYRETPDAGRESDLLGALAYQSGGVIAHLGGPNAPDEITEFVLDEFVKLVRDGIRDARQIMRGGGQPETPG